MLDMPPVAFFGYPSRPASRRVTVAEAASSLSATREVNAVTWEGLSVTGRLIITEVTAAIDDSLVSAFDVTDLNENVLFELGYAIGRRKSIWLLADATIDTKNRRWEKFGLLRSVGQNRYSNSEDIVQAFLTERPHFSTVTVLDQLLDSSSLGIDHPISILYLAGPHDTNGERAIRRSLERERSTSFDLAVDDPRESGIQPLTWYADSITRARGVVAHLVSPQRQDASTYNARAALLCGLAVGLDKTVLMIAEDEYNTPIDYQETLKIYSIPREAAGYVNGWLKDHHDDLARPALERASVGLQSALGLRSLRLGSHVAEDEVATLQDYFVETRPYVDVLDGGTRLYVGRKGTGKSAVLLRAAEELSLDARNVVCTIKPPGYEITGLVRLLRAYRAKDTKGYAIESVWKFLLYSELAKATIDQVRSQRAVIVPGTPEADLISAVEESGDLLSGDFAVRLERAVEDLLPIDVGTGVATGRLAISEALHETVIRDLRQRLVAALADRHRVAILVDNLDKGWERDADIGELTQFLLGLLGGMRNLAADLRPRQGGRRSVDVSLAVFLRSDIFWHLSRQTREPDKLMVSKLDWSDPELLVRVLEERYASMEGQPGSTLWTKLFTANVEGQDTRDWLLRSILPRPRDLVYLANAAITNAVNRRHDKVLDVDLRDARLDYSSYAIDSVLVEGEQELPWLADIIYEFAGAPSVLDSSDVLRRIARARPRRKESPPDQQALVLLLQFSFLGVETTSEHPTYVDNTQDLVRANAIALARARDDEVLRYHIHPAFRPFLEVAN